MQDEDVVNESGELDKSVVEPAVSPRKPVNCDYFLEPTLSRSMYILTNRQEVVDKLHRDKKMQLGEGFKSDNALLGRAVNKLQEEFTNIYDNEAKRYEFELSGRNRNVMSTTQGISAHKFDENSKYK